MGEHYYVVGVIENKRVISLKKVYDDCLRLGITPPPEALRLFEDEDYEEVLGDDYVEALGVTVDVDSVEGSDGEYRAWLLVELDKLPDGVSTLAFIRSY